MKHLTAALIMPSDLISIGVEKILGHLRDISVNVIRLNIDDYEGRIGETTPSILIADTAILGSKDALRVRQSGVSKLIGISTSQIPHSVSKMYDYIVSIYDSPETLASIVRAHAETDTPEPQKELSPREKEVIIGIVKGLSNKEIANSINISVNTVMTHRRNISSKLQIHSPAGLTIYAIVSNLVTMDEIKSTISQG